MFLWIYSGNNKCFEFQDEIVDSRNYAMCKGLIDKRTEPFSVRQKEFWDVTTAAYLLSDRFSKKLSHEPDGLIFQPSSDVSM